MKRSTFIHALCASSAAALTGCTTSSPSSAGRTTWPPVAYKSVRAFVYDCEVEHNNMTFLNENGRMHKGVINAPGAVLSAGQTSRLLAMANTPSVRDRYKSCYVPHHAIVFYDAEDRPVASLEICFTCRRHIATPSGTPEVIDYGALWALMHELGVPAQGGAGYYRQLFRQTQANS